MKNRRHVPPQSRILMDGPFHCTSDLNADLGELEESEPAARPEKAAPRKITIWYRSIDRFRETRKFKTLAGAKAYAARRVGTGEVCSPLGYAVSFDGIGQIEVDGATLEELLGHD